MQDKVDSALEKYFPSPDNYSKKLYNAMRYSLFSEGKRFRPVLCLLTARTFGINEDKLLPLACAIEYVHTYSLVHDDLPAIDNDDLRRGKPTCHIKYGENIAILAGDALYAEAFYLISEKQNSNKSMTILRLVKELAFSTGVRGMVGGQVVDVISTGKSNSSNVLKYIHTRKTGRLITFSVRSAAIMANCSDEELLNLTNFARNLGLAFQITDDILDVEGQTEIMGKPKGSDSELDKITFPKVFGLDKSKKLAKESAQKAIEFLGRISRNTIELEQLTYFVIERKK